MSEADISMPDRTALKGVAIPSGSEIYAPGTATPTVTATATTTSTTSASLLQQVFSFPAMLATFLVGRVFYEGRGFVVDPDLWWHIKVGQNIVTSHHWPTSDPFSYTVAGNPWMAYEWLGDVVIGTVARVGGLLGLDVFLFVWASIVMLVLYGYTT